MSLEKITQQEIYDASMERLANYPTAASRYGIGGLNDRQLKARYDKLAKLAIAKLNVLIDSINSPAESADALLKLLITPIQGETEDVYLTLCDVLEDVISGDLATYLALTGLAKGNLQAELEELERLIGDKVSKIAGKGLSTNDFGNAEKAALAANTEARHGHLNKAVLDSTTASYTTEEKDKLKAIEKGAQVNPEIIDNLTSVSADNPLSANQGRLLNEKVDGKQPAGNYATLVDGKIPSSQLPSYVDDVIEKPTRSEFPEPGESGKIYVAQDTNITYRWSGTGYVEIYQSLSLGETAETAFRGDHGKLAYEHSQSSGNPHGTTAEDIGIFIEQTTGNSENAVMSQKATTVEINALKSDLDDLKSGTIQQTPLFANNIDECTDTTKLYVLPDGYIYAYKKTTVPVDPQPNFTNQLPISTDESGAIYNGIGYKEGYRVSSSGTEKVATGYFATGLIPCTSKSTIRIKNATVHDNTAYCTVVYYNNDKTPAGGVGYLDTEGTVGDDGTISFVTRENANDAYVRLTLLNVTAETIVTVNEEISYTEGGTTEAYAWVNTGIAFVSGDADDKITALETDVSQIKAEISKPLCTNVLSTATSADRITIYEGVGYKTKTRLNSSGDEATHSSMCVSGYIPVNTGDVLRIKGISPKTGITSYIFAYNSENVKTGGGWLAQDGDPAHWASGYYDSDSDMFIIPLTENDFGSGFDAIRFSAGIIDENTIVTINEEIVGSVFDVAKQNRDAISAIERATGAVADDTEQAAINRIKNWTYPIFEDAPVFLLDTQKSALSQSDYTTEAVYAKYDALMAAHSDYITREDCGLASDNSTHIYVYHFKESEPHYASSDWSETKPVLLICSGIHPTEMTGIYSLYNAMEEIATNSKLLDLRRNLHFVIVPIINPTGFSDATYGVRNPDGIQAHYNFEVDFRYPGTSGYVPNGNRNYGGETPLSIPETQYFDNLMQTYKDTIACVISCHNNDVDTIRGTGVIWCSCASNFTCNLGFRFVDKMSAAWREKYGTAFDEGVAWANAYALQKAEEGSSLFNPSYVKTQPSWDHRVGMASISSSGGTEYKQALKYGIHGLNVETCDRCLILDKDFSKTRTANVMTLGTETYINFFRTYMAVYDPKNKKDYAPNLPWTE